MHRILFMCLDAALSAVILLPLFLILHKRCFHSRRKTLCFFLMAVYLSGVYAVVGLPTVNYIRFDPNYNLEPFAYMFSDFTNSLLNVLLFIPLGGFLPLFWRNFRRFFPTVLFGFCTSGLIEVLQLFTLRASDVNDLMTNTLGTVIGWGFARILLRLVPGITPGWKTREVYLVCAAAFTVMFFIQPFLADLIFPFLF